MELLMFIVNNSIVASLTTIFVLFTIFIFKKHCSASFKYKVLKTTLLFYIVPFYMIFGEIVGFLSFKFQNNPFFKNFILKYNSVNANYEPPHQFIGKFFYIIWIIVTINSILWFTFCYIKQRNQIKNASNIIYEEYYNLMECVKNELNIKKNIKIVCSSEFNSPMLCGIMNSTIVFPVINRASGNLKDIITHELVHYKRKDLYIKYILLIIQIVHWFNPIIHIFVKTLNKYLEYSCDEEVVKQMSIESRKAYGLAIVEYACNNKNNYLGAMLGSKKDDLKERLCNMLDYKFKKTPKIITFFLIMAISFTVSIPTIAYGNYKIYEISLNEDEYAQFGQIKELLNYMSDSISNIFIKVNTSLSNKYINSYKIGNYEFMEFIYPQK